MAKITNSSEKKLKGYWPGLAIFAVVLIFIFELDFSFGSSGTDACKCEEELFTWAQGGNTFNTGLKVDCLEKYIGPDILNVYHKTNGVSNYTFLDAWDNAKKDCQSR